MAIVGPLQQDFVAIQSCLFGRSCGTLGFRSFFSRGMKGCDLMLAITSLKSSQGRAKFPNGCTNPRREHVKF